MQNQDPVLNEGSRRLGVSLRQTEDQLTRDMLQATASFINCVGGVNGDSPTEITRSDVDTVIQALMGNNAYTITDLIQGEDRFGSSPVRNAYLALCSTDLVSNLNNVAGYTNVSQYPNNNNVPDCEYGAISNLRFQVSSIGAVAASASSLGKNVYSIFCTGREAYANVKQEGYADSFIYRAPIYSDPLAQNASIGWKTAMVPRLLNDLWLINLRCTLA